VVEEMKELQINKIVLGDTHTELKNMPANSVDCCLTSPPYWALREYDTASWEGGDPGCDHVQQYSSMQSAKSTLGGRKSENTLDDKRREINTLYKDVCSKCGAKRVDRQLGLEPTFQEYISKLCDVFDEVKRVLKSTGTCWVNIGDTYMGNSSYSEKGRQGYGNDKIGMINKKQWLDPKYPHAGRLRGREHVERCDIQNKCLCQIPHRFAIEMTNRGWILRNTVIWHKKNCMPSSVKDRFTTDFEYVFFFVKKERYWFETQYEPNLTMEDRPYGIVRDRLYDYDSKQKTLLGREGPEGSEEEAGVPPIGRNKRCVWSIPTKPYKDAHFAVFPPELCETPIKAGCPEFLCKKCKKPRQKLYKTYNPSKDFMEQDARTQASIGFGSRQSVKSLHRNEGGVYASAEFVGYSDCGCGEGWESGIVLDPFMGSGTTALTALKLNRRFVGIELSPKYKEMAEKRIKLETEQKRLF
jgi:site-specific DNA-methyltransferase (adenine-specific)